MAVEQRLRELGIELPPVSPPAASYVSAVRTGNLVYLSGAGPTSPGAPIPTGKVGADVTTEEAAAHARQVGVNLLAVLRAELGDLDRARRVVKLLGFINAPEGFTDSPRVLNGASDLLIELYGETGKHARSAIGIAALPGNAPVEVEMIVAVK